MRILATADIHGVMGVYEWLVELVQEYQVDLLLIAGDLFAADWEDGQREQARQIIPVLKRVTAPCFSACEKEMPGCRSIGICVMRCICPRWWLAATNLTCATSTSVW